MPEKRRGVFSADEHRFAERRLDERGDFTDFQRLGADENRITEASADILCQKITENNLPYPGQRSDSKGIGCFRLQGSIRERHDKGELPLVGGGTHLHRSPEQGLSRRDPLHVLKAAQHRLGKDRCPMRRIR